MYWLCFNRIWDFSLVSMYKVLMFLTTLGNKYFTCPLSYLWSTEVGTPNDFRNKLPTLEFTTMLRGAICVNSFLQGSV